MRIMANIREPPQSYLDYLLNSNRRHELVETKEFLGIKGTCNTMCPEDEIILRKSERMVHILEVVGDEQKLVKCYSRPAADTNLAIGSNLRPFHVLKKTVDYLLFEVTKRKDVSTLVIYNFVTDRLRAVRQDVIIQRFEPHLQIVLLEPMIRFHVYYGYLLCEESINDYSPILNRNILLECLKTCLYCYDEVDRTNAMKTNDISLLINSMIKCNMDESGQRLNQNRELIEALYVLTNFYEESPMWRLGRLSTDVWHAPPVRFAYGLASAALRGHYVTVCKTLPKLCPLMFCAVVLILPTLQRCALRAVCVAYSSRGRGVPLRAVRAWLGFAGEGDTRAAVRHYGLAEADGLVTCARAAFRDDAPMLPPKKFTPAHLQGKMDVDYIMTYLPGDS